MLICVLCNNTTNLHVDHTVQFKKLYCDFMNITNLQVPSLFDDANGNMACFKQDDHIFKDAWDNYHKTNAVLRILCKKCNLTRKKYKGNKSDEKN